MAKPRAPKKKVNGSEAIPAKVTAVETSPENGSAVPADSARFEGNNEGNNEMKTAVRKSSRRPEIVKTESRSNLVPINLEEEIRRLAYLLSERRGFAPGHETEDWLAAEHEIRERYHEETVQTA